MFFSQCDTSKRYLNIFLRDLSTFVVTPPDLCVSLLSRFRCIQRCKPNVFVMVESFMRRTRFSSCRIRNSCSCSVFYACEHADYCPADIAPDWHADHCPANTAPDRRHADHRSADTAPDCRDTDHRATDTAPDCRYTDHRATNTAPSRHTHHCPADTAPDCRDTDHRATNTASSRHTHHCPADITYVGYRLAIFLGEGCRSLLELERVFGSAF
jgi:hypothetical protein